MGTRCSHPRWKITALHTFLCLSLLPSALIPLPLPPSPNVLNDKPLSTQGDLGGQRTLQKKWTSFLKAKLVCSMPELNFVFNVVHDVFILKGADRRDTVIYGVFTSQWSVILKILRRGSEIFQYNARSLNSRLFSPDSFLLIPTGVTWACRQCALTT